MSCLNMPLGGLRRTWVGFGSGRPSKGYKYTCKRGLQEATRQVQNHRGAVWALLAVAVLMRWIIRMSYGRLSGFSDFRLRPLGADYRVSRRDGWFSTGRVRPRSAPRGPGDIWGPLGFPYRISIAYTYPSRPLKFAPRQPPDFSEDRICFLDLCESRGVHARFR